MRRSTVLTLQPDWSAGSLHWQQIPSSVQNVSSGSNSPNFQHIQTSISRGRIVTFRRLDARLAYVGSQVN